MSARHRQHKRKIKMAEHYLRCRLDLIDSYADVISDRGISPADAVVIALAERVQVLRAECDQMRQVIGDLERSMPK